MASTSLSVRSPTSFPFATAEGARGRVGAAQLVGTKLLPSPLPPVATTAVPRWILLPAAAGIWDFLSDGVRGAAAASLAVRRGMQLFQEEFDRAIELVHRQKQYLWQRGLSLYYPDRCKLYVHLTFQVGLDSRPVTREAYTLFKDGGDPEKLSSNFLVVLTVKFSIHHYTLDFTINLRKMQSWQSPTLLLHPGHPIDQDLYSFFDHTLSSGSSSGADDSKYCCRSGSVAAMQ